MQIIYFEKEVKNHSRVARIIKTLGKKSILIECENYQEVFNLKSQNFRIQKQRPCDYFSEKKWSIGASDA